MIIIPFLIFISILFITIGIIPTSKFILNQQTNKKLSIQELPAWFYDLLGALLVFLIVNLTSTTKTALMLMPIGLLLPRKLPALIQKWKVHFHRKKLLDELEGATMVISSTVRGGFTLLDAYNQTSGYVRSPLKEELENIVQQVKYGGKTLSEALKEFSRKWESPEIDMLAHATKLATEFGGTEVPEIMRSVSKSIQERKQAEKKIKAKTTYQRISATAISIMPLFIVLGFKFMAPEIYYSLTHEAKTFFYIGLALTVFGWYGVFKIMNDIEEF
ncbi:MAG: type II secretion system F family protein [Tepidibacillus sp.]